MTVANWIVIIVPIIGVVGAAILYIVQKHIDRETEVRRERRQLYRSAAVALERSFQEIKKDKADAEMLQRALFEFEQVVAEIQVSAPDSVAEAWMKIPSLLLLLSWGSGNDPENYDFQSFEMHLKAFNSARAEALNQMRRDTFGDTRITLNIIMEAFAALGKVQQHLLRL
ncbi:hypothetical protein [Epibacterium ulvae]|uniref:hypothetical protein n=1 Tax=Epibacterium ulvae TaxID=1156985 RepID=UPI000B7EBE93|nr:hypothetical protein [Epibacterium ulvae]